ncbi:Gfo/Idh/MocA family oxidoreductase [Sphingomonadaceae bacterium G21617-S1]|nr:Gfo/Idh/MocA family oxidoreductase [Sphingomonadaceae bacterium G21617-S1]
MNAPIKVGLIGANPGRGWALSSHLPALLSPLCRDHLQLVAVATSREETARKAAEKFNVAKSFAGYEGLVSDPEIDLVIVSVKLPAHYEIVRAAIDAGKHVYCEWPLGISVDEARALADRAASSGVHTMIGLQGRQSPVLRHAAALIDSGRIGAVLSVSVVASGFGWGAAIEEGNAYLFDKRNGATMDVITGGHMLDALIDMFGSLDQVSAILETVRKETAIVEVEELQRFRSFGATVALPGAEVAEGGSSVIRAKQSFVPTSPDQMILQGRLGGRTLLSLHIRGGMLRASGLLIEVTGSEGELRISGPAGVLQMMPLTLEAAWGTQTSLRPIEVPPEQDGEALAALGPVAANIARAYRRFADDIRSGTRTVPDFALAAQRQALLQDIAIAASTGQRISRND